MRRFCPEVSYRLMDEGKAHLARTLETMYNLEPMVVKERNQQNHVETREIKHKFDAYPKLNTKIQEHYSTLYGKRASAGGSTEEETTKTPLPFGFGAFAAHKHE